MRGVSAYSAMGAAFVNVKKNSEPKEEALKEVGGMLRDAREAFDLSLQQAASDLHIAAVNLKAIEAGDWSVIPGEVYARGYLRKYAEYLGFEQQAIFSKLHPAPLPNNPIVTPVLHRRHGTINIKPFILFLGMAAIGTGIGALLANMPLEERESQVKDVPQRLQHYSGEAVLPTFYTYNCLHREGLSQSEQLSCYFSLRYETHPDTAPYQRPTPLHLPERVAGW
jgi:hypothetical protein